MTLEGDTMDKKFRLPKEAFIDDQDVEGHRVPPGRLRDGDEFTVLPAPPSIGLRRAPGHGGEILPTDEDVDGHRIK
jgi:hypothetical protein